MMVRNNITHLLLLAAIALFIAPALVGITSATIQTIGNCDSSYQYPIYTMVAHPITITGSGSVAAIGINFASSAGIDLQFALYSDSGGHPQTLLSYTEVQHVSGSGWVDIPLDMFPYYITPGNYWLSFHNGANPAPFICTLDENGWEYANSQIPQPWNGQVGPGSHTSNMRIIYNDGAPLADFHGNVTRGPAPLDVIFTDTSTENPTSWYWDFGDGGNSNEQNPEHAFSTGAWIVTLNASNVNGYSIIRRENYITAAPSGTVYWTANYTAVNGSMEPYVWNGGGVSEYRIIIYSPDLGEVYNEIVSPSGSGNYVLNTTGTWVIFLNGDGSPLSSEQIIVSQGSAEWSDENVINGTTESYSWSGTGASEYRISITDPSSAEVYNEVVAPSGSSSFLLNSLGIWRIILTGDGSDLNPVNPACNTGYDCPTNGRIYVGPEPTSPATDSNTRVLLKFNGDNGSTAFIDEEGHTFYLQGSPYLSDITSKFGGASGYFKYSGDQFYPGINDAIFTNDILDWQHHDWTVDYWVNFTEIKPFQYLTMFTAYDIPNISEFNAYVFSFGGQEPTWVMGSLFSTAYTDSYLRPSKWYHIAVEYDASLNTIYWYKNGELIESGTPGGYPGISPFNQLLVGGNNNSYYVKYSLQGYIDEFRVSDTLRYAGDFTPPTREYISGTISWANTTFDPLNITESYTWSSDDLASLYRVIIKDPSDIEVYNESVGSSGSDDYFLDTVGYWHVYLTGDGMILSDSSVYVGPNDPNTLILLHYDGPNGLTYFYDEYGHNFTTYGNANISTATDKFGGSSGYFASSGDNIQAMADDINWTAHNWTVDFWVNLSTLGDFSNANYIYSLNSTQTPSEYSAFYYASGFWLLSSLFSPITLSDPGMDILTWHHMAIEQSMVGGGIEWPSGSGQYPHIMIYRDGNLLGDYNTVLYASFGTPFDRIVIGSNTPDQFFPTGAVQGYLDEFRVSDNVRYSSDFTPADEEYIPQSIPFPTGTISWTNVTSPGGVREPFTWSGTQSPSYNVVIKDPSDIEVYNESAAASGSDTFLLDVEGYWHLYFTGIYHTGRVLSSDTMYVGTTDPNTLILLHNNGANESTTFIDEYGHTVTPFGNAKILTTEYKFGGASGHFEQLHDGVVVSSSDVNWLDNWTIDFWMNSKNLSQTNYNAIFGWTTTMSFEYYINYCSWCNYAGDPPGFWYGTGYFMFGPHDPINESEWHHIALEYTTVGGDYPDINGNYSRVLFFDNGQLISNYTVGGNFVPAYFADLIIGGQLLNEWGADNGVGGYIDEVRVSNITRYTVFNFTPESDEYLPQSIPTGTVAWDSPTAYIDAVQGYSWSAINISSPFIAIHGPDGSEKYNSTVIAGGSSSFTVNEVGIWNISLSGVSLSDIVVSGAPPVPPNMGDWTNQKAGDISNIVVAGILVAVSAIIIGIVMKFFITKK